MNDGPIVDLINRRFDDLRHDLIQFKAEIKQEMRAEKVEQDQRLTELEKIHWKVAGGVTVIVFILQFLYDKFLSA